MKIRVLTATGKGKLKSMAEMLATMAANDIYKADIIPPAYSCENERLIILLLSPGGIPKKNDFSRFIQGLNRQRARNVAFIIDGKMELTQPIIDTIKANDVNVIEPILTVNGGSIFSSKMSAEEKDTVVAWYNDILTKLA